MAKMDPRRRRAGGRGNLAVAQNAAAGAGTNGLTGLYAPGSAFKTRCWSERGEFRHRAALISSK